MASIVSFRLNGEVIALEDPPPELLLIDYLRSPEVGLTGAKKGCGQGGCGACTVIVSQLNERSGDIEHRAVNSCLRPVCALGGLAVTTIEGTGAPARLAPAHLAHRPSFSRSAAPHGTVSPAVARAAGRASENRSAALAGDRSDGREPINEVAYRLAMNNGTQCGYCSAGFVMNMSALLAANPAPTKREIEDVFDGNLCRCTGFRSILTGMKTFAADWSEHDEVNRMKLRGTDTVKGQFRATPMSFEFPADEPPRPAPVNASRAGRRWVTPETIDEACAAMRDAGDLRLRLVAANTSFGIYPREFLEAQLLVDIGKITELHGVAEEPPGLRAGAGATYTELLEVLAARDDGHGSARGAAELMARRTAGTIVRNAATLGGNTMLVLAHIAAGEPFPSDLLTALAAIGADIEFARASTGERARLGVGELIAQAAADPAMHRDLLLLAYHLPAGDENDVVLAQKVALREVNAHSLVNATTRLRVGEHLAIEAPVLVYGGIAPYPWRPEKTEAELAGRALSLDGFPALAEVLRAEVGEQLELSRDRMAGLPSEGITDAYRTELAVAFLYKALVNALLQRTPDDVPPAVRSSGEIRWGRWPVSDGTQDCKIQRWKAPVSQPYVKLMALYQTTGSLHYTHEIELPPSAVNAAFVHSRRALADSALTVPGRPGPATRDDLAAYLSQRFDAFIALLTHEDVPEHGVNLQGMGSDQPLLTDRRVSYVGQAIALVIAEGEQDAIEIAEYASEHCVDYRPVDWTAPWNEPVLSLDRAIEIGSVFPDFPKTASWAAHVWKITRPGSRFEWTTPDKNALDETIAVRTADVDGVECTVVESTQRCGGQAHFYMETQACVAVPLDGGRLLVQPSTQSPAEMHQTVAMTLGVEHNRVEVRVNPVGGGYGGKTEQTRFVAGPAALAAHVLERPVRLVLKREHDTALIGKRHAFYGQYQIAIDRRDGRIRGFQCRMWGDGGAFYDCSYIVSNCIQLRADNAYRVPNFENQIDVCRTNTAPSTAFRAFGDIQGKLLTENAIDDAAFAAGVSAEDVRFANFYERGDVTPFGQALSYCYMKEVWEYLIGVCDFERQKAEVEGFNRANRWRKRGIAMVPVKYGSGYNLVQLEQAMAYVVVHAGDGSVTIHQGGVEMGQGALTIIEQVASYVLNVPMDLLHVEGPNTSIIPNPASTGASTGTAYNATAVKRACEELRARLTEFGHRMLDENGQDWCAEHGIDFWTRGEQGWAAQAETPEPPKLVWQNLVSLAYQQRVSLNVAFVAPIRGGETPVPALTFKPLDTQRPIPGIDVDQNPPPPGPVDSFTGFTYSAACSVVEVDILTGEVKVLRSDIVYDTGWSLNPAIDIGQVEGAFVQGLGYVLTERLVYQPDTEERGTLTTDNTWRYKLPATATIPLKLNTYLFPRDRVAVPEDGNELFSSKEVGEPPLVLATSVFFAIKAAVRASRLERGLDGLFRLDAPATVQEVRRACDVATGELE